MNLSRIESRETMRQLIQGLESEGNYYYVEQLLEIYRVRYVKDQEDLWYESRINEQDGRCRTK